MRGLGGMYCWGGGKEECSAGARRDVVRELGGMYCGGYEG